LLQVPSVLLDSHVPCATRRPTVDDSATRCARRSPISERPHAVDPYVLYTGCELVGILESRMILD